MKNATVGYVDAVGKSGKLKARIVSANSDNAKIFFSNFLTYSTKESFETEYYVNNQFYISKIVRVGVGSSIWLKDSKCFYMPGYDN